MTICRIVNPMPPHKPTIAIHLPASDDCPFLIESSSIQPTIAAGIPVSGPQQKSERNREPEGDHCPLAGTGICRRSRLADDRAALWLPLLLVRRCSDRRCRGERSRTIMTKCRRRQIWLMTVWTGFSHIFGKAKYRRSNCPNASAGESMIADAAKDNFYPPINNAKNRGKSANKIIRTQVI